MDTGTQHPHRRRGLRARLFLVLLGLLFALGTVEIGIRLLFAPFRFVNTNEERYWTMLARSRPVDVGGPEGSVVVDPQLGWRMKPNLRRDGVSTNSKGLRGTIEYAYARRAGTKRIVVLGDSFTYGLGVGDSEVYTHQVERRLEDVEVLNLGANGYGTDQQYLTWEVEGKRYSPDIVLLAYYVPDFHRNVLTIRELPKPRFLVENGVLRLTNTPVPSTSEVLAADGSDCRPPLRLLDVVSAAMRTVGVGESERSLLEKAEVSEAILGALDRSVQQEGARLFLVVIPHRRFRDYPDHLKIERALGDAAARHEIPMLVLTESFEETESSGAGPALYQADGHWSAAGHERASEAIIAFLRREGVL